MAPNLSQPTGWHAPAALLPDGWARSVDIHVDSRGLLVDLRTDVARSGLPTLDGPVVPGMPNVHSHAFQRILVGRTQELGGEDDFWSWRSLMYRLVEVLQPEDLQAVTAWTYADMLACGYTSVAEFHYLHADQDGRAYADVAETSRRIVEAADTAGIGLTLLPVLYRRSGFGDHPLEGPARRFGLTTDQFAELVSCLDQDAAGRGFAVGIAPHSLRAVSDADLQLVSEWSHQTAGRPVHIHVAEQPAEVAECLATTGSRPVDWLLERGFVNPAWTLVHATHTTTSERTGIAQAGGRIALCPTTEADLGDGVFPLADWIGIGGLFGIGSDSNASVSPLEELRMLTYVARLASGRRGALPLHPDRSAGAQLWQRAARAGAPSLGHPVGELRPGYRADFLELDPSHPAATGLHPDQLLDALVMSGDRQGIARTVVAGKTLARFGRHVRASELEADARKAIGAVLARLT